MTIWSAVQVSSLIMIAGTMLLWTADAAYRRHKAKKSDISLIQKDVARIAKAIAAYEDTNLTPSEVSALQAENADLRAELEKAEAEMDAREKELAAHSYAHAASCKSWESCLAKACENMKMVPCAGCKKYEFGSARTEDENG